MSNLWVGKIPLEKEMATYLSILAWEIPWTEEPGGLKSKGVLRVRGNFATKQQQYMIYFVVHLKLTQHCKSTKLQ